MDEGITGVKTWIKIARRKPPRSANPYWAFKEGSATLTNCWASYLPSIWWYQRFPERKMFPAIRMNGTRNPASPILSASMNNVIAWKLIFMIKIGNITQLEIWQSKKTDLQGESYELGNSQLANGLSECLARRSGSDVTQVWINFLYHIAIHIRTILLKNIFNTNYINVCSRILLHHIPKIDIESATKWAFWFSNYILIEEL